MRADELMVPKIYAVGADASIATAKNIFLKHHVSRVLVVDGDDAVGILSEAALAEAFARARDPVDTVRVRKVMRKRFVTVKPNATLKQVAKKILNAPGGCVIVDDDGTVGIITKTDLLKNFTKHYAGHWNVSEVMSKRVRTIGVAHSMFRAARDMSEYSISRLVVKKTKPVGIVTSRDIALASFGMTPKKLVFNRKNTGRSTRIMPLTVEDVMQKPLSTIPPKSDAASAAKLMLDKDIGSVVVMERGNLVGIVTQTDIVKKLAEA